MRRRWRWIAIVVAAIVGLGCAVLAGSVLAFGREMPFASGPWHVTPNVMSPGRYGNNVRARMVNDLLRHHLRPGMGVSEVSDLLGEPDEAGDGHRFYELLWLPRPDQELVAWLRWRSTCPVLAIKVAADADGKWRVVKAGIARHVNVDW